MQMIQVISTPKNVTIKKKKDDNKKDEQHGEA